MRARATVGWSVLQMSPPSGCVAGTRAEVGGEVGNVLEVGFMLVKQ